MSTSSTGRTPRICIVGAGAAGLWAASAAARRGADVVLLEKTRRTGTKVLASGGTRCNLTTSLDRQAAARTFGPQGERFLAPALRALPPRAVREHFERLGVATKVEPALDKVFPVSNSAREVRDALLRDAEDAGVQIVLGAAVTSIRPHAPGWQVQTPQRAWTCDRLLLCPGGRSYPKTGTTGDGYRWLAALDLEIVDPVPALVPLYSDAQWVHALSGLTVEAIVSAGEKTRRRPVLFTHRGLSGPGPMDVSEAVSRGTTEAQLDLLPDRSWEALRADLIDAAGQRGAPRVGSVIPLPRRLLDRVCRQAGLSEPNPRVQALDKTTRHRLIENVKRLRVPITGTAGWSKAEVTAGGLALTELDRRTLEVHHHPGLYVFGEVLDLTGPIGGLNFLAAFATAEIAARAATAPLEGP